MEQASSQLHHAAAGNTAAAGTAAAAANTAALLPALLPLGPLQTPLPEGKPLPRRSPAAVLLERSLRDCTSPRGVRRRSVTSHKSSPARPQPWEGRQSGSAPS